MVKMTKGKSSKKGRPEKVKSRSLEKRKNKGHPLDPPEWESQVRSFKERTSKEGNNEE